MKKMYRVIWEIDIDAESEIDAINQANEIMQDKESIATFFWVKHYQKIPNLHFQQQGFKLLNIKEN